MWDLFFGEKIFVDLFFRDFILCPRFISITYDQNLSDWISVNAEYHKRIR